MTVAFSGSCLCGAVTFESKVEPMVVGHCHCEDCRKSSGTGHCTHMAVPDAAFELKGAVQSFDKPAASGNMVRRHFCGTCGSPVYSINLGMPGMVFPRASLLDQVGKYSSQMSVWTSRAMSFDPVDGTQVCFETEVPKEAMAELMPAE